MDMRPSVPRSIRQLRRLLAGMPVAMLTTNTSDGGTRSRPMLMHEVDDSGWLMESKSRKPTRHSQPLARSAVVAPRYGHGRRTG